MGSFIVTMEGIWGYVGMRRVLTEVVHGFFIAGDWSFGGQGSGPRGTLNLKP